MGPSLLGLLGFSSCDHFPLLPASEYGTPYGEFKVDINVTDESGKPLKNIAVNDQDKREWKGIPDIRQLVG